MVMCAFLELTAKDLAAPAPYVRVLAFNDRGREILKTAKATGSFVNAGEPSDNPYWALEQRASDLYGLFAARTPEHPGREHGYRVFYNREDVLP